VEGTKICSKINIEKENVLMFNSYFYKESTVDLKKFLELNKILIPSISSNNG
jgi:hypothetical protein